MGVTDLIPVDYLSSRLWAAYRNQNIPFMKKILGLFLSCLALQASAQIPNTLSAADKVYGLSKFWQEVNYNFVYLDKVDSKSWDSAYRAMITEVQLAKNDYEYYRLLQKFCALLKDGHTNVYMPQVRAFETMNTMFGDYRLFLENIDGKAIVVRTNKSRKDEIPVGSEVIGVNGLTTSEYVNKHVAPYISSSTDYVLEDWSISRLLQGLEGEEYQVKIRKPKGEVVTLKLKHARTEEKEVFPDFEPQRKLLDFQWHPGGIAYVSLNSFSDPRIDTLFLELLPELYKAKGLIVDLRFNGGGSTEIGREILQYLTKDTLLYGSRNSSRLHVPAFKAWGRFTEPRDTVGSEWAARSLLSYQDRYYHQFDYAASNVALDAQRIVVPTVLLIGHQTASAAEDFLIYADNQKHMIRMGENTFGSTGQPFFFDLPGGGSARVCTKKDTYPDGREFVGYGVKPDVTVKKTLDDHLKGRDAVLSRALEHLKTHSK